MLSYKLKLKLAFLHNVFFSLQKQRELHRIELNGWKKLIPKFQV